MLVVTLNSAESQRNRFGLASQPQFRLTYVPTWYFSVLEYYILNSDVPDIHIRIRIRGYPQEK